jgi:hypothetical protein
MVVLAHYKIAYCVELAIVLVQQLLRTGWTVLLMLQVEQGPVDGMKVVTVYNYCGSTFTVVDSTC